MPYTLGTTYLYRDSNGEVVEVDKTPEMLAQDSDQLIFLKTNESWIEAQREIRNDLLKKCDWTQGEDVPDSIKLPYRTYRTALRDLPTTEHWPLLSDSDWPTEPEV